MDKGKIGKIQENKKNRTGGVLRGNLKHSGGSRINLGGNMGEYASRRGKLVRKGLVEPEGIGLCCFDSKFF